MKRDSDDVRGPQLQQGMDEPLATETANHDNPQEEEEIQDLMTQMDLDMVAGDRTVDRIKGQTTLEVAPGVGPHHEGESHHRLQMDQDRTHLRVGTPTSLCWTTKTSTTKKRRIADVILRLNMSESSSERSENGSRRWLVRTSSMRRPTRVSRT